MANDKKYYWLKLHRDFFKRHDVQVIEGMDNGKDYLLFYLKLLVESLDHDGNLRFSDAIPYNEKMLATITHTNVDIVRSALELFVNLGMIDILDDETIYMSEIEKFIGYETAWAKKKRDYREQQKLISEDTTRTMSSQCPPNVRQEYRVKSIEYRDKSIVGSYNIKVGDKKPEQTTTNTPSKSSITKECYDSLVSKYGKAFVDERASRAYNDDLLTRFCEEDAKKQKPGKKTNRFNDFDQRTYDFEALEKKLISNK